LYEVFVSGIAGMSLSYWLYGRTPEGIKKQAYKLFEKIEDNTQLFGIKKNYDIVPSENDEIYTLIFNRFFVDIRDAQDLNIKIEHLKSANDYFYTVLQKIKWLIPKLKHLQKDDDEESGSLHRKLNWYRSFIGNLKNKCVDQIQTYEDQMIWRQNNQAAAEKQKIATEQQKVNLQYKKNKNRRENVKVIRELRRVLYDWRWLISSAITLSVGGSETIKNLCKKYPQVAILLGVGVGGTLFSFPLSNQDVK